jgi:hypothetical protein
MRFIIILALLYPFTAQAKDVALMLNDQEQAALRQILDVATKAGGMQIAPNTVYLLNKLNTAPVVTDHKDTPAAGAPEKPEDKPQ